MNHNISKFTHNPICLILISNYNLLKHIMHQSRISSLFLPKLVALEIAIDTLEPVHYLHKNWVWDSLQTFHMVAIFQKLLTALNIIIQWIKQSILMIIDMSALWANTSQMELVIKTSTLQAITLLRSISCNLNWIWIFKIAIGAEWISHNSIKEKNLHLGYLKLMVTLLQKMVNTTKELKNAFQHLLV